MMGLNTAITKATTRLFELERITPDQRYDSGYARDDD